MIDFEMPCFEEVWESLPPWKETATLVRKGISQTFRKNIGSLSFAARRIKLLKYIEKKYQIFNVENAEFGGRKSAMTAVKKWLMVD